MFIVQALIIGMISSMLTSVFILASLAYHPRIWIGDAPKAMQEALSPLNDAEKRLRLIWAIPTLFSMLGIAPIAIVWLDRTAAFSFGEVYIMLWFAWMLFNVVDLLIIDWLIIVYWSPQWTQIPEAEPVAHFNNYSFHFQAFLKGTVAISLLALIVAGLIALL